MPAKSAASCEHQLKRTRNLKTLPLKIECSLLKYPVDPSSAKTFDIRRKNRDVNTLESIATPTSYVAPLCENRFSFRISSIGLNLALKGGLIHF